MQINRIMPNNIMAKVQNLKNKNLLSKFKTKTAIQTVPVVAAPIVAYMAINSDKYKSDVVYRTFVDKVKKEFQERDLPFKDEYVNFHSGSTSTTGQKILNNYDETKKLFVSNELDFSNAVIDASTGKPNLNGRIILKNMKETKNLLNEQGIPVEKCYYDSSTGCLNRFGNKALSEAKENDLSFKGYIDEQQLDIEAQDNFVLSKDEMKILHEMGNIDIRMDPVLQEIHDAPPLNTVEGLMTSIFGEIPAGVNFDWDLWTALKEIANDIMDIGDWM